MKIAINASILGTQPTGTNVYTEQVLQALARLPEASKQHWELWTPRILNLPPEWKQHLLPSNLGRSTHKRGNAIRRFFWNQRVLPKHLQGFDRCYCPTYNTSTRIPDQIITIHDLIALRYPRQHPFQYAYCRWVLPGLLRRCHRIIAISEFTRQEIIQHYRIPASKIVVVPNGVDHTLYQANSNPADSKVLHRHQLENYALVVGATFPHKNIEVLLRAWENSGFGKELQLAVIGAPNAYVQSLRAQAQHMGIEASIQFLGYVEAVDLPALYRQAQMLLYPSRCEGFGLPLLEAMACGCPVIASNTSSLPEVGDTAALYADPEDPVQWRNQMQRILQDHTLRPSLVQKGLERVQLFTWENTARGIARVLGV